MKGAAAPPFLDRFGRTITNLRISVTDRCNFRCFYCMPQEGFTFKPRTVILRYEDIAAIAREAIAGGITCIKITGGEPLVKRDIESLVQQLAGINGITDLSMTTNGSLLTREKACLLKRFGLMRINISLDTLDPARFSAITVGADLADVLAGIDAALEAGFSPIKINTVLMDATTVEEIEALHRFCAAKGLVLQTIARFSLEDRRSSDETIADRPPPCFKCNRLRLTADGYLKPCLFSDREFKVDLRNIRQSLLAAVNAKPEAGQSCSNRQMHQIGG